MISNNRIWLLTIASAISLNRLLATMVKISHE